MSELWVNILEVDFSGSLCAGLKSGNATQQLIIHIDKLVPGLQIQMDTALFKIVQEQITHALVTFIHV